jgi:carboxypeptidase C (cathepsin A)
VISSIAATALILKGCAGVFMELGQMTNTTTKNDSTAVSVPTVNELSQRLANAKLELSEAIENADLEQMTAIRFEIKSLPEKITIAEMRELKLRLKEIEREREQNADKIKDIMAVRREKNMQYVEKVRELEPFRQQVDEYETRLSFAKNDDVLLLQERRELNAKLFNLSESMRETF